VVIGLHLPELLQPDAVFARLAPLTQPVGPDDLLGEGAARPFGDHDLFAHQRHAGLVVGAMHAVALDAHVAAHGAGLVAD
jgi:hypothetical protein